MKKKFTVFEAGYGGPHNAKHVLTAESDGEVIKIVAEKYNLSVDELTAIEATGKEAEEKFFQL